MALETEWSVVEVGGDMATRCVFLLFETGQVSDEAAFAAIQVSAPIERRTRAVIRSGRRLAVFSTTRFPDLPRRCLVPPYRPAMRTNRTSSEEY